MSRKDGLSIMYVVFSLRNLVIAEDKMICCGNQQTLSRKILARFIKILLREGERIQPMHAIVRKMGSVPASLI